MEDLFNAGYKKEQVLDALRQLPVVRWVGGAEPEQGQCPSWAISRSSARSVKEEARERGFLFSGQGDGRG
jgi:hypothetical protein